PSRRRHTRWPRDWSSDVCSSDLGAAGGRGAGGRFGTTGLTLGGSGAGGCSVGAGALGLGNRGGDPTPGRPAGVLGTAGVPPRLGDRKSTRLNSSHVAISEAGLGL